MSLPNVNVNEMKQKMKDLQSDGWSCKCDEQSGKYFHILPYHTFSYTCKKKIDGKLYTENGKVQKSGFFINKD